MPPEDEERALEEGDTDESHLRSVNEVIGYHVQADDGAIGHIEDFVIDRETWSVQHVAVDTRNWLPGKVVTVAPARIDDIIWTDSNVYIHMTKDEIKESRELR